jgi:nucleoside phosphorylase/cellulose biosynthesis protein BcsQ
MALANIAVLLSKWGYNILVVDWDLEAPGLEFFFKDFLKVKSASQRDGVIDILNKAAAGQSHLSIMQSWAKSLIRINIPRSEGSLHLLTSGKRDDNYFSRVRALDLKEFYAKNGGFFIETLRNEWKRAYDFVLIDSRTGITDIGGICTIQLPDILVALFTATDQSLNGVIDVLNKAKAARRNLPVDRSSLLAVPIPSKFDTGTEFVSAQEWLDRFAAGLSPFYTNWLPTSVRIRDFLPATKIPYIPYFSFGEKLAVLEEGTIDPAGLGYAYETLAAVIANNFNYAEQVIDQRDELIRYAIKGTVRPVDTTDKKPKQGAKSSGHAGPRIFLAYTVDDREKVSELYKRLSDAGFRPWMDVMDLLPGERWENSIRDAIDRSDFFLVCLSSNSSNKRGFVQKEIKIALDILYEKPIGEAWLIPVRLDDSAVPSRLQELHWLNLYEDNGWQRLLYAIQRGYKRQEAGTALIFTSLPAGYIAVRSNLTNLREETMPDGTVYEIGRFSSESRPWEVGILELDTRDMRAALEAARAIQYVKPSVVISVGVAAGIKNVSIGDIVAATKIYGFEPVKTEKHLQFQSVHSLGVSSYKLEQRARAEAKKGAWLERLGPRGYIPHIHIGPIVVSGELLITSRSDMLKFLKVGYRDALAFEIGSLDFLNALYSTREVDVLVVRGISDLIDSEKIYGPDVQNAAIHSASAFILEILGKIGNVGSEIRGGI